MPTALKADVRLALRNFYGPPNPARECPPSARQLPVQHPPTPPKTPHLGHEGLQLVVVNPVAGPFEVHQAGVLEVLDAAVGFRV